MAEDAGIDRIVAVDHVVMGPHTENYVWGKFPVPPDAPWFEPLIMLAAVATATSRIRLATGILIAPLRPAVLLAKQAATLDVLSAVASISAWAPGGSARSTTRRAWTSRARPTSHRHARRVQARSWNDLPADLDTPTLSFRDVYCAPQPLQAGGVPLWIGGTLHARNLDRAVRFGDAWIPIMGASLDDIAAGTGGDRRRLALPRDGTRAACKCRRRSSSNETTTAAHTSPAAWSRCPSSWPPVQPTCT